MRRVEQAVVLTVLERRRKVKKVDGFGQVLHGIMEISGLLCIVTDKYMIQLGARRMEEDSGGYKLGAAAAKILKPDLLSLGKREPVRQLKKAGRLLVFFQ